MKSKEEFKNFVSKNPSFADYVKDGTTSWQELFELYSLYDEDSEVFDKYKKVVATGATTFSLSNIIDAMKGINLDSFQNNLESIQKAVSFLEELTKKDDKKGTIKKSYSDENIDSLYDD